MNDYEIIDDEGVLYSGGEEIINLFNEIVTESYFKDDNPLPDGWSGDLKLVEIIDIIK